MSRRALCVLLATLLMCAGCLSLCSCEKDASPYGTAKRTADAAMFSEGRVIANNLDLETVEIGDDYSLNYLRISGLKNGRVEKAINKRIYEVYETMLTGEYVPPYRGINVRLKAFEGATPKVSVLMSETANFNNILSINASCYITYEDEVDFNNSLYYGWTQPLNFDLNTGRELSLGDLFYDDVNYLDAINAQVAEQIMDSSYDDEAYETWYDYGPRLAAPFAGFTSDPKFYINYDGALNVVLDYSTPEFSIDYYPRTISIDDREHLALTCACYNGKKNIYTDASRTPNLLPNEYDALPITKSEQEDGAYGTSNISINRMVTEIEDMPESLRNEIVRLSKDDSVLSIPLKELHDRYSDSYSSNDGWGVFAEIGVNSVYRYGDYTTACIAVSEYCSDYNTGDSMYDSYYDFYQCYKGDNAQPLALSDVFVPGADYNALLKQAFLRNARENKDIPYDEQTLSAFFDEMLGCVCGFSVEGERMYLAYRSPDDAQNDGMMCSGIVRKYFPDTESPFDYIYLCTVADYSDLGAENLVLFD